MIAEPLWSIPLPELAAAGCARTLRDRGGRRNRHGERVGWGRGCVCLSPGGGVVDRKQLRRGPQRPSAGPLGVGTLRHIGHIGHIGRLNPRCAAPSAGSYREAQQQPQESMLPSHGVYSASSPASFANCNSKEAITTLQPAADTQSFRRTLDALFLDATPNYSRVFWTTLPLTRILR